MKPDALGSAGKRSTTRFPKHLVEEFSKEFFSHDYAVMEDPTSGFAEFVEARDRIILRLRRASQNVDGLVRTIENRGAMGVKI